MPPAESSACRSRAPLRAPVVTRVAARLVALGIALALTAGAPIEVHADRVTDLSRTLRTSKREKNRIAAAVSLGRLHDRRAVPPLTAALRDRSHLVRAVAAAALGAIADPAALPDLRRATRDDNASVRRRAREAIAMIDRRHRRTAAGRAAARPVRGRPTSIRLSPRERPRLVDEAPRLFVSITSVADKSATTATTRQRSNRQRKMRELLAAGLDSDPGITLDPARGAAPGITRFAIDGTITKFQRRARGPWVEVEVHIRLSISNSRGKMLSFLSGGATVQVPRAKFTLDYEPQMKLEALEGAIHGVNDDLVAFLSRHAEAEPD